MSEISTTKGEFFGFRNHFLEGLYSYVHATQKGSTTPPLHVNLFLGFLNSCLEHVKGGCFTIGEICRETPDTDREPSVSASGEGPKLPSRQGRRSSEITLTQCPLPASTATRGRFPLCAIKTDLITPFPQHTQD